MPFPVDPKDAPAMSSAKSIQQQYDMLRMMLAQSHMAGQTASSAFLYQQLMLTMTQLYSTCNIPNMTVPGLVPQEGNHDTKNPTSTHSNSRKTDNVRKSNSHSLKHNNVVPSQHRHVHTKLVDNHARNKTISSDGTQLWRPAISEPVHNSRVNEHSKRKLIEVDADGALDLSMKKVKHNSHNITPINTKVTQPSGIPSAGDAPLDFSTKRSIHQIQHSATHNVPSNSHRNGFNTNVYKNTINTLPRQTEQKPVSVSAANCSSRKTTGSCQCTSGKDIWSWSVEQVCSFLNSVDGCAAYVKVINNAC